MQPPRQNAASLTTLIVAFGLLGVGIVLWSLAAGFDAGAIGFALGVYAFFTIPLFLAATVGRLTAPTGHASFDLTPDSPIDGMRVKRRLLWIENICDLLNVSMIVLAIGAILLAECAAGPLGPLAHLLVWVVLVVGGPAVVILTPLAVKALCLRLGWMTEEEAECFPFPGHYRWTRYGRLRIPRYQWPESWLEPVEEPETPDQADSV